MVKGTCSYNDSLYDLFYKKSRIFSFETCPYISDSPLRFYKLTNIFAIYGPTRSGKTLLLSHMIFDLLKSNNSFGKIVFIDLDLGFDFETFVAKLESSNPNFTQETLNSLLSNLLYLPAQNSHEFGLILNSLEFCLNNGSLVIHCLVVDSMCSLYALNFSDVMGPNVTRGIDKIFNQIVSMCKRHSIFLIYTNDIDLFMYKKTFHVEIEAETNDTNITNEEENTDEEKEEIEFISPKYHVNKEDMIYENIFTNELLISFDSNNSNEYKYYHFQNDHNYETDYENIDERKALPKYNQTIIKSFIPESWTVKGINDNVKDYVSILLYHSRNLDKNYITISSKDQRDSEFHKQISIINQNKQLKIVDKDDKNNKNDKMFKISCDLVNKLTNEEENIKNKVNNNTHLVIREMNENKMKQNNKKRSLQNSENMDLLNKYDFRVYRIDSQNTYTRCNIETVTFD